MINEKNIYPNKIAVALNYDGQKAPKVTAKGTGITAKKILEIAEEHDIPLQNEPELAKILSDIPLGDEIPKNLYVAVAEVIAFAYFLTDKKPETK